MALPVHTHWTLYTCYSVQLSSQLTLNILPKLKGPVTSTGGVKLSWDLNGNATSDSSKHFTMHNIYSTLRLMSHNSRKENHDRFDSCQRHTDIWNCSGNRLTTTWRLKTVFLLSHTDGRVRFWHQQHESMDPTCLMSTVRAGDGVCVCVGGVLAHFWPLHTQSFFPFTACLSVVADCVPLSDTTIYHPLMATSTTIMHCATTQRSHFIMVSMIQWTSVALPDLELEEYLWDVAVWMFIWHPEKQYNYVNMGQYLKNVLWIP